MQRSLFFLFSCLVLVSCKPEQTVKKGSGFTYNKPGGAPATVASSISLSTPATSPNTDSTPTFLLSGVISGETVKIFSDSNCSTLLGSAVAAGETVLVTSTPLAPGLYTVYTHSTNSSGSTSACSSISASYEYSGLVPSTATSLVLLSPTSPNYSATPRFRASVVANGDTVKLFTDAGCTTQVGSALASSTSVDITATLSAAGNYSFYTRSSNVAGTSACSGALATYNYLGASALQVSWTANREKAVNTTGGGYRVYYSTTQNFSLTAPTTTMISVPYAGGASTPVSTTINNLLVGTYYFKIVAFSALNAYGTTGGTTSEASAEFSLTLP